MGKTFQLFAPRVKVPPSSWHLHLAWSPDLTRHYWHTVYTYSIYHSRGRNAINTRERFHKREMKWRIVIFLQRKTGVRIRVKEKRRECTHTLQVPARARVASTNVAAIMRQILRHYVQLRRCHHDDVQYYPIARWNACLDSVNISRVSASRVWSRF